MAVRLYWIAETTDPDELDEAKAIGNELGEFLEIVPTAPVTVASGRAGLKHKALKRKPLTNG